MVSPPPMGATVQSLHKLITSCERAPFFCVGFLVSIRPDSYGRSAFLFYWFAKAYAAQASYQPASKFCPLLPCVLTLWCRDRSWDLSNIFLFSLSENFNIQPIYNNMLILLMVFTWTCWQYRILMSFIRSETFRAVIPETPTLTQPVFLMFGHSAVSWFLSPCWSFSWGRSSFEFLVSLSVSQPCWRLCPGVFPLSHQTFGFLKMMFVYLIWHL